MELYTISALVTVGASLLAFGLAFNVGMARRKYKTGVLEVEQAPAVTVANRVHLNTVENMVVFLPLLWVGTVFADAAVAGWLGIAWLVLRVWYALAYLSLPKRREIPFMLSVACIVAMAGLALWGILG